MFSGRIHLHNSQVYLNGIGTGSVVVVGIKSRVVLSTAILYYYVGGGGFAIRHDRAASDSPSPILW